MSFFKKNEKNEKSSKNEKNNSFVKTFSKSFKNEKNLNNPIKIFFDIKDFSLIQQKREKIISKLLRELSHTSYSETLLYSPEGIYQIDEPNDKIYFYDYIDDKTEKITLFGTNNKNDNFDIYCDYGKVDTIETFRYPIEFLKIKKYCYVFTNKQNSSLKLIVEKNVVNNEILDIYCILNRNLDFKENSGFYEEIKEFHKLVFNE